MRPVAAAPVLLAALLMAVADGGPDLAARWRECGCGIRAATVAVELDRRRVENGAMFRFIRYPGGDVWPLVAVRFRGERLSFRVEPVPGRAVEIDVTLTEGGREWLWRLAGSGDAEMALELVRDQ